MTQIRLAFFALLGLLPALLPAQIRLQLKDFASGFVRPIDIAHCGDSRLFVVEQRGMIWIVDSTGKKGATPFLDIDDRVINTGNERGLLGLAFHPNYRQNGFFYVNYIKNDGVTRIARFSVSATDPTKANPASELMLLEQTQPFNNHKGGCTKFGPDGYLYLSLGDGGSGGDPNGNGQKTNTFLGKMLRIDVDKPEGNKAYSVPNTNPFINNAAYLPEIWSLGWRNVWRFSFDRLTGDMWMGEVGQSKLEEIDFEAKNKPGLNYGWRCYEGTAAFNTAGCQPSSTYVAPVFEYANPSVGCSVTGGFVYRGKKHTPLYGKYIFADYCSGVFWATERKANGTFETTKLADLNNNEFSTFGEDRDGELYVALLVSGKIQRVGDLCGDFTLKVTKLGSPVCDGSESGWIYLGAQPTATPVKYQWSDNTTLDNIIYLNPGTYTVTATDGNNCVRVDSFVVKSLQKTVPNLINKGQTVLCSGDSTLLYCPDLFFKGGNDFQWQKDGVLLPNASDSTLWVKEPGTYRVRSDYGNCVSQWSALKLIDLEILLNPLITTSKDTLSTTTADGYQWFLDGVAIPGATGPTWVAQKNGTYTVRIHSDNGCFAMSLPVILVVSGTAQTSPNVLRFSLAPNPTPNAVLLNMELLQPERFSISLTDTNGRQIFLQTHNAQRINLPVNLDGLPAGTYYLNVQLESGAFTRPLVKM